MASPTLLKTWQRSFNLTVTPSSNELDLDNIFIAIKNALKAFALFPWTVAGSSNGTVANMTGTDSISTAADLVHNTAGNAHSWIVLTQPATSVQVCFDFSNTTATRSTVTWSPTGGYTGGSTTARPTATDEQTLVSNSAWQGTVDGTQSIKYYAHILHSEDGENTRVFIVYAGAPKGFWSFETVQEPTPGWEPPLTAVIRSGTVSTDTNILDHGQWVSNNFYLAKGTVAATMPLIVTAEIVRSSYLQNQLNIANEISSEYPAGTLGLWHIATVGQRGRHGYLPDMWMTVTTVANGDSTSGTIFTVLGDHIVYTGGTALTLT